MARQVQRKKARLILNNHSKRTSRMIKSRKTLIRIRSQGQVLQILKMAKLQVRVRRSQPKLTWFNQSLKWRINFSYQVKLKLLMTNKK